MKGGVPSVVLWDRAAREIEEADSWWRAHRSASTDAVAEDVAHALDLLSRQPGIGVRARSEALKDVRRLLLPRVGYFVYYRFVSHSKEVQVLAFWHARRGTEPTL